MLRVFGIPGAAVDFCPVFAAEQEAREMFDLMVKQIEKSMESIDFGDITKPVGFTVTLNYQNDGKVAFSKTFTVDPK